MTQQWTIVVKGSYNKLFRVFRSWSLFKTSDKDLLAQKQKSLSEFWWSQNMIQESCKLFKVFSDISVEICSLNATSDDLGCCHVSRSCTATAQQSKRKLRWKARLQNNCSDAWCCLSLLQLIQFLEVPAKVQCGRGAPEVEGKFQFKFLLKEI